jgi:hypothetical protein
VVGIDSLDDYCPVALKQARLRQLAARHGKAFAFLKLDFSDMDALAGALAPHRFGAPHNEARIALAQFAFRHPGKPLHKWAKAPDASEAVDRPSDLMERYPQIEDIHFWAQLPGEPVSSGDRRMDYIADGLLPRLKNQD